MSKDRLDLDNTPVEDSIKCGLASFQMPMNSRKTNNIDMETRDSNRDLRKATRIMLADEKDIGDILSIIKETCFWLKEKGINQWNPEKYLKKYDKKYFLNAIENKEVYIITIDNCTIGTFSLKWEDKDIWKNGNNAGYLHHLAVKRNFAGKELGQITIENAKDIVKFKGKRYLRLDCKASNGKLNQYYIKCGFNFKGYFKLGSYRGSKYEVEV